MTKQMKMNKEGKEVLPRDEPCQEIENRICAMLKDLDRRRLNIVYRFIKRLIE